MGIENASVANKAAYIAGKSSGLSLLPFLIFIAIYMGAGIILQIQGVEMAFYQFPSVVAMFIAVIAVLEQQPKIEQLDSLRFEHACGTGRATDDRLDC